ncbi:MAG: hypothetical protein JSU94_00710 [Phycisphaerales bacterium]|nr:MAG: hypothetical protein JSU94_00710 [Phycisphaerales bacterium]
MRRNDNNKVFCESTVSNTPTRLTEGPCGGVCAGPFLLVIAFAASSAGNLGPALEFCLLCVLLAWIVLLRRPPMGAAASAVAGLVAVVCLVRPGANRWAGLWYVVGALAACDIAVWLGSIRGKGPVPKGHSYFGRFTLIACAVLFLDLLFLSNPGVRPFIVNYCRIGSEFLTGIGGQKALSLGSTYWSIPVLVAFVLIALWQPSIRARIIALIAGIVAVAMYFAVLSPLQGHIAGVKSAKALSSWYERAGGPFQLAAEPITLDFVLEWLSVERPQLILIGLLAGAYYIARVAACPGGASTDNAVKLDRRRVGHIAAAACPGLVIGLILCWLTLPKVVPQSKLGGRKAAVMTSNILMNVPIHGKYGDRSLGMFGRLPGSLRSLGLSVDEIGEIGQLRDDHEILILINLQENFSTAEKRRILGWVERGGGLLVLTDHTGDKGLRLPVNDLLGPLGLEVNFDTAKLFSIDGGFSYEMLTGSPLTAIRGARWRGAQQYGTGASIRTFRPAVPMVQARSAFVDPGSFSAVDRGFLGNLKYDRGELLGDVPVGGYSSWGRGRAILFGDTSPFQNGAFTNSHEFVRQVLGMLLPGGPRPGISWIWWGLLSVIAAGISVLFILGRRRPEIVIFTCTAVLTWAVTWGVARGMPAPLELTGCRTALVDISHCPYAGYEEWTATDLGGLAACLMREGYTPVTSEGAFDRQVRRLGKDDVLFLVCPLWKLSESDTDAIDGVLRRAGKVIINCGFEEAANVNPVLERYDFEIRNIPLGATAQEEVVRQGVNFFNAWEIQGGGTVLATVRGRPVVVAREVGPGILVVIGDSKFFWNANVETRETHVPGNIGFLGDLLQLSADGARGLTAPARAGRESRGPALIEGEKQ